MTYKIKIYYMGKLCSVTETKSFNKAKSLYYKSTDVLDQYTQLCIGRTKYTTAEAERYFGAREDKEKFVLV